MAMQGKKDHQPWSPRIESSPLFVNSADYERGLRHESSTSELDLGDREMANSEGEDVRTPSGTTN
jgi:hypothetical protein